MFFFLQVMKSISKILGKEEIAYFRYMIKYLYIFFKHINSIFKINKERKQIRTESK